MSSSSLLDSHEQTREQSTRHTSLADSPLWQDAIYLTGLAFITIGCLVLFFSGNDQPSRGDMFSEAFFINYGLAATYLVVMKLKGKFWGFPPQRYWLLWLVLAFISCFTLNRTCTIFQTSTDWFTVYLCITTFSFIAYPFATSTNKLTQNIIYVLLGASWLTSLYFSIYLLPISAVSLVLCWFFGISLHAIVPALMLITLTVIIWRTYDQNRKSFNVMLVGMGLPLAVAIGFALMYAQVYSKIENLAQKANTTNQDLPIWVTVSQHLPNDWLMNRIIKSDIVYQTVHNDLWRMSRSVFDEQKEHDPLVVIGSLFTKKSVLETEDRIQILSTRHDLRHYSHEKLWSGKDLVTHSILTEAKLFPQFRFAYTEKTLEIKNTVGKYARSEQQEALYTFHLPEGAVITSLSLWVNGKEETAYLTTKQKADSAYRAIVGVERRDPSVVHWQEGNSVTVRVFPCTPQEMRKFKIGVTAPLQWQAGQLTYQNIRFEGTPATPQTQETVKVSTDSPVEFIENPFKAETFPLQHEGGYSADWQLVIKDVPLSVATFSFQGKNYQVQPYQPVYESFSPENIYLDVNKNWTKDEFQTALRLFKDKKVYVFTEQLTALTPANEQQLFEELSALEFTIFPLYQIAAPSQSLLVSKSTTACPYLADLKYTEYSAKLKNWLQNKPTLRIFNLTQNSENFAPYLKSLREFRTFLYAQGTVADLQQFTQAKQFIKNSENDQKVVLHNANMCIQLTNTTSTQNAPDHLLRLFAYNDIMRRIGGDFFRNDFIREDLVNIAATANVVSPVSSLIVLEKQEDYDRFDIKKSKNSLQNASHKSSGAVPEPHEWLLMGLVVAVVLVLWWKK